MDASTFEFDDPLPRVCRHCKWASANFPDHAEKVEGMLACSNRLYVWGLSPIPEQHAWKELFKYVKPDHTCDHWEERE